MGGSSGGRVGAICEKGFSETPSTEMPERAWDWRFLLAGSPSEIDLDLSKYARVGVQNQTVE
jgi:hypothetical protein